MREYVISIQVISLLPKTELKYGCPPHVGDAIVLLKQSWDGLSSSLIAACWKHSQCLHAGEVADLASTAREYHKKVEADALADMISNLKITNPSVMNMLKNTGLDVVAEAAQINCICYQNPILRLRQFTNKTNSFPISMTNQLQKNTNIVHLAIICLILERLSAQTNVLVRLNAFCCVILNSN